MQNAKIRRDRGGAALILQTTATFLTLFVLLVACGNTGASSGSERARTPESVNAQQILIMDRPPIVTADDAARVEMAHRLISRMSVTDLQSRQGARRVDASELPWLSGSATGRDFLTSSGTRVLVRGRPQSFCPVAFTETGGPGVPKADIARNALNRCLAEVPDGCGCRVVAIDDALLVKRDEITYATGIAARIRARSLGLDALLVAEEQQDGSILLRDLSGIVGKVSISKDRTTTVELRNSSTVYQGQARDVGFRRGRLARRIYATNDAGERFSLLIGFDPGELAEFAGAWLAWPPDA